MPTLFLKRTELEAKQMHSTNEIKTEIGVPTVFTGSRWWILIITTIISTTALLALLAWRSSGTLVLPNAQIMEVPVLVKPPPELPREWIWEKKAVTFDHMYRDKNRVAIQREW
ncbi:MAG: hypothetical protein GY847_04980 [Proteobacteria bacterium]|nr:hypothetical protein [Pseudomonadota bacterium]